MSGRITVATKDPAALRRAAELLKGVTPEAVDQAKQAEGLTYDDVRSTPVYARLFTERAARSAAAAGGAE